jgi:hypothetical protein
MLSPLETGTTWGRPWERGRSRETGPRTGAWHPRAARRDSKARQLAGLGEARSGKAPHLIHGGPCLILVGRNVLFQDRHAGNRRNATRDDPSHTRERRRVPHAAGQRPEAVGAQAVVPAAPTKATASIATRVSHDLIRARPGGSRPLCRPCDVGTTLAR